MPKLTVDGRELLAAADGSRTKLRKKFYEEGTTLDKVLQAERDSLTERIQSLTS